MRTICEAGSVGLILAGGFPSKRETILAVVEVSGVFGSDMLAAGKRLGDEVYRASRSFYNLTDGTPATI